MSVGGLLVLFLIPTTLLVAFFIWASNVKKELDEKQEAEFAPIAASLNQEIDATYRLYFEDDNLPRGKKLEKMRKALIELRDNALKEYMASHAITKSCDTFSSFKLCGVSNTHFYCNLGTFLSKDSIPEDIEQKYEEIIRTTNQFAVSPIKKAIDILKKAKTDGISDLSDEIALDDILYYKVEGTVSYVSNVHGGGVNMQGAVTGAIIGGGAAAIIGSQLGTETKTEIITKDDRKFIFCFNEDGDTSPIDLVSDDIDSTIEAFRTLIPNKEESVVQMKMRNNAPPEISSADELKKFKELLDSGIISQEEFDAKKKQLLGL